MLALIMLLDSSSDEETANVKRVQRHNLFVNRNVESVFAVTIERHLLDNDTKFKEYFRVSPFLYNSIITAIETRISKTPSIRYPRPIEPKIKL